jgi:DNA-binding HxlR family transcriptional regulator
MGKYDDYGIIKVPEEVISKMTACPIDFSFKILGQKFMILILRDLILFGKKGLAISWNQLTELIRRLFQ